MPLVDGCRGGTKVGAKAFAGLCARLGVTQSMGAVGTSADNALAESFNATLKRETLQGAHAWPDQAACRRGCSACGVPEVGPGSLTSDDR